MRLLLCFAGSWRRCVSIAAFSADRDRASKAERSSRALSVTRISYAISGQNLARPRRRCQCRKLMRRTKIEEYLDRGRGSCLLRDARTSSIVEENWFHFDGKDYRLL